MKNLVFVTEEISFNDEVFSGQGNMVFNLIKYLSQLYNLDIITLRFKNQTEKEYKSGTRLIRIGTYLSEECINLKDFFSNDISIIDKSYIEFKMKALDYIQETYRTQKNNTIIFLHYGYSTGLLCKKLKLHRFKIIIIYYSFRLVRYLKSLFSSDFLDLQYDFNNLSICQQIVLIVVKYLFRNEKNFVKFVSLFYKLKIELILPLKMRIYYESEIEAVKFADKVIVINKEMKDYIANFNKDIKNKIVVIYPGIGEELFVETNPKYVNQVRKKFDISGNEKILLFIGRINPMKGLEYLLESLVNIEKSNSLDGNIKVIIVGFAYGSYEPYFQRLISISKSLNNIKVLFLNPIYGQEKLALYDLSTIFVLPSIYEPFGIVALEAMARGKPVIISSNCGIGEIINDNCGIIVDYKKFGERSQNLSEAIKKVFKIDTMSMGLLAFKEAKLYSWEEIIKDYVGIFDKILND